MFRLEVVEQEADVPCPLPSERESFDEVLVVVAVTPDDRRMPRGIPCGSLVQRASPDPHRLHPCRVKVRQRAQGWLRSWPRYAPLANGVRSDSTSLNATDLESESFRGSYPQPRESASHTVRMPNARRPYASTVLLEVDFLILHHRNRHGAK